MRETSPPAVLLIGYGEMGHALEYLLHERCRLDVWQRHPAAGTPAVALEDAVPECDFVFLCVPAAPIADIAARIRPVLSAHTVTVSIAKGLDDQGRLALQAMQDAYGGSHPHAVLYGPMISEEIRAGHPAYAQLGATDADAAQRLAALFAGSHLHLELTDDLLGISWAAVLKNVYAILFGAADELDLGDNTRGFLASRTMREMESIVSAQGASADATHGLAGLGDLMTTATSAGSHHHELGRLLVRGVAESIAGEGVHTVSTIARRDLFDISRYPLIHLAYRMISKPAGAGTLLRDYLGQTPAP